MSAYGAIPRPTTSSTPRLLARSYALPSPGKYLTVFPFKLSNVDQELVSYLAKVFNAVVEEGRTYPQKEPLTEDEFAGYFFSESFGLFKDKDKDADIREIGHDCFVGLLEETNSVEGDSRVDGAVERSETLTVEEVRQGRSWKDSVLGMFCM